MGLRIRNHTNFNTRQLRAFILAGLRHKGADTNKIVEIRYLRSNSRTLGLGLVGRESYTGSQEIRQGRWIQLNLPKDGPVDVDRLARTLAHEIDHTLGLKHADMIGDNLRIVSWADGFMIGRDQPKQRPRVDPASRREEHARNMLKKAETRLKRAKTIQKKWAAKVRYYDRKAAARMDRE